MQSLWPCDLAQDRSDFSGQKCCDSEIYNSDVCVVIITIITHNYMLLLGM